MLLIIKLGTIMPPRLLGTRAKNTLFFSNKFLFSSKKKFFFPLQVCKIYHIYLRIRSTFFFVPKISPKKVGLQLIQETYESA